MAVTRYLFNEFFNRISPFKMLNKLKEIFGGWMEVPKSIYLLLWGLAL